MPLVPRVPRRHSAILRAVSSFGGHRVTTVETLFYEWYKVCDPLLAPPSDARCRNRVTLDP